MTAGRCCSSVHRAHALRSARWLAVAAVGLLAACGAAGSPGSSASQTATAASGPPGTLVASAAPSPSPSTPDGWTPYTSSTQHVAFALPPGWKVVCDGSPAASWLLVDAGGLYTTCPQGDGQVGIFVESVAGTESPAGLSLISAHRSLYSNVQATTVPVGGVSAMRLSGDQTAGQGSGSAQVEYDIATGGRTCYVLAVVGGVAGTTTATAAQVDQFVQTLTFAG
jgi:hypothetical protein